MKKKVTQQSLINIHTGKMIGTFRKKRGFTQGVLASGVGLTRTSIVNIEKGRQSLTIECLLRMCALLKCEPVDILPATPKVVAQELKKVKTVVVESKLMTDWKW